MFMQFLYFFKYRFYFKNKKAFSTDAKRFNQITVSEIMFPSISFKVRIFSSSTR